MTMPLNNSMPRGINYFGLTFDSSNIHQVTTAILSDEFQRPAGYHLVNSYTIVEANRSSGLFSTLQNDVLICDGKPLALILRQKDPNFKQIRGADLMRNIIRESTPKNKHFFLGSTNQVLEELTKSAILLNPALKIVGSYSPPFHPEYASSIQDWKERILNSGATIVWVGLGTPKQDFVVGELATELTCRVLAVGAAFDYLSGTISEAPRIIQKVGLEWLYRLIREPRRLAKRYLVGNLRFAFLTIRYAIKKQF